MSRGAPRAASLGGEAVELRGLIREAHEAAQALSAGVRGARAAADEYTRDALQTALSDYSRQVDRVLDEQLLERRDAINAFLGQVHERTAEVLRRHCEFVERLAQIEAVYLESSPVPGQDAGGRRAAAIAATVTVAADLGFPVEFLPDGSPPRA